MKIFNFFRKPINSLFLACLVLFYSCNPNSESTFIEPSLTSEYFNYVISNSTNTNGISFKNVEEISSNALDKINDFRFNRSSNSYSDESFTATIVSQNKEVVLHILPLSNLETLNKAHVFFEKNGEIQKDYVEVTISNSENGYIASWNAVYDNSTRSEQCTDSIISCDCQEGSSDVQNIGTVIAAAGLFGCFVCAFVGAAIAAVGAAGSLACPDEA